MPSFPHSNVGLAQAFPGENAGCACEGPGRAFEFVGGVPSGIVFDDAAGVGRRVGERAGTTELFGACAAHHGFAYSFRDPRSGNEKGSVENRVGAIRRAPFVPVPQTWGMAAYNERLLGRCVALSEGKPRWSRGEAESRLFFEDRFAMSGLPARPFSCVGYAKAKADGKGKARVDGPHSYSTVPELAGQELAVGPSATGVAVYDRAGALACGHARPRGTAPTDDSDPSSQLRLLGARPGAWSN
ncbi:MAG: hypothetical protein LKE37_08825 [Atopobiaceae bacterium]|nr:hypothetical protein [Atopobiaceae bacterium]